LARAVVIARSRIAIHARRPTSHVDSVSIGIAVGECVSVEILQGIDDPIAVAVTAGRVCQNPRPGGASIEEDHVSMADYFFIQVLPGDVDLLAIQ